MKNRSLGKTGLSVSEIGYGDWGLGGACKLSAGELAEVDGLLPRTS
jgi:aryl-alcohol dehydrogenase-like predicted oxidoreductase